MPNLFLNPDARFDKKIENFPNNLYRIDNPTSRVYRLLYALLEIGIGQAKGMQDIALMSESSLAATTGQELDEYFQMFGIRRTKEFSSESSMNPQGDDAKFRIAISKYLQALSLGGTTNGIRLMAEASSGFKCEVIETWRNPENVNEKARLIENNQPVGNEVLIFVYPDAVLDLDEKNIIRTKVINNCKVITPLHTSITVEIKEEGASVQFVPIYVSGGSFSFIDEADIPELFSQEKEVNLNNTVTDVKTYQIESEYKNQIGIVDTSFSASDTLIYINEQNAPLAEYFTIKLEKENGESEIVFVKNRTFIGGNDNTFSYEIKRSSNPLAFSTDDKVYTNIEAVYSRNTSQENVVNDWKPIPLADSPDNYPNGKFAYNPNKYGTDGKYLFEWSSQNEFIVWFTSYISKLGGEVSNNRYRMNEDQNLGNNSNFDFGIINKVMGIGYEYVRPIPRPKE